MRQGAEQPIVWGRIRGRSDRLGFETNKMSTKKTKQKMRTTSCAELEQEQRMRCYQEGTSEQRRRKPVTKGAGGTQVQEQERRCTKVLL